MSCSPGPVYPDIEMHQYRFTRDEAYLGVGHQIRGKREEGGPVSLRLKLCRKLIMKRTDLKAYLIV